jgi:hypothetical protein
MAQLDEAKVQEIKQFLQRLESLVPSPNSADAPPASMPRQPPDADVAPHGKWSVPVLEEIARRALHFARTGVGTSIIVAAVSALLSTFITVTVIRATMPPQVAGTESVFQVRVSQSQPEQAQVASVPTPEAGNIAPAATAVPAEPELPEKSEPPGTTPPSAPEADAGRPQPIAEKSEQEGADPGKMPEATLAAITPSLASPPEAEQPDAAQDFKRAQLMLANGQVGAARLLLESAAERGNGEAALLLGSTFDALRLKDLRIAGIVPDAGLARHWYERAAALGAQEAQRRLVDFDRSPVPEWRRLSLTTSPAPRRACTHCDPVKPKRR